MSLLRKVSTTPTHYSVSLICLIAITILASCLYVPFLSNGLIFDDHNLFTNLVVFDFAQTPIGLQPRTFPYFTLGFVHVLTDSIEANRAVTLVLHILVAWTLYRLLNALLYDALVSSDLQSKEAATPKASLLGALGAIWFAIHPVAVYGAGYLVQRTILFATLFSLLSLWFYRRALLNNRVADLISAALFYSAAVFSKEHAVMLPFAAIMLGALYRTSSQIDVKKPFLYLTLCAPAALTAVFVMKWLIGTNFEPDAQALTQQLNLAREKNNPFVVAVEGNTSLWIQSIVMQANLFWNYFAYWLVPDVRTMSIDMRVDFSQTFTTWWLLLKATLFATVPFVAAHLFRRKGLATLFAIGLLYSWLLFWTELVAIRIQDPFVLYRSYLWAPGFILMIAVLCTVIPRRWLVASAISLFIVVFFFARERLSSMTNEGTVWKDAAAKISSHSILGSDRILYNRALSHYKEKQFNAAIADLSFVISRSPSIYQAYHARGSAYYEIGEARKALEDFNQGIKLNKIHGPSHFGRGAVLEHLGCDNEALKAFETAITFGVYIHPIPIDKLREKSARESQDLSKTSSFCPHA